MRRSKRLLDNKEYEHHWVNHQKKQYWFHNKITGVQNGTQYIENEWRRLQRKINEQAAKTLGKKHMTSDHVFAAAWITRRSEHGLDDVVREVCAVMGDANLGLLAEDNDASDKSSDSESEEEEEVQDNTAPASSHE